MPNHLEQYPLRPDPVGIDFLRCELELAIGFVKVSQNERQMQAAQAAERAKLLAEHAYETFKRLRALVSNITEEDQSDLWRLEIQLQDALATLTGEPQELPNP